MRHQTYSYSQSTSQALNKPKIQTRLNEETRASRLTSGFFRPDESGGNLSVPRSSAETEYFSLITNNEHGLLVIPGSTQPHSRIRPGIFPDTQRTEERSTAKSTFQPVFALRGVLENGGKNVSRAKRSPTRAGSVISLSTYASVQRGE